MSSIRSGVLQACSAAVLAAALLVGCAAGPSAQQEIGVAFQKYVHALRTQDSAALAELFAEDATMGHEGQPPVRGRNSIKTFLESFANYKVLSHEMQVQSVSSNAIGVTQTGIYQQAVRTPEGQEIHVSGKFILEWRQGAEGKWLIHAAKTAPSA